MPLAVLEPYKYAGYPMLITTIQRETGDDELFSKTAPILTAASEVAFHTMNTSALNAEELRRENGIVVSLSFQLLRSVCVCVDGRAMAAISLQALQRAFARCVSVLSSSSKPDDMAVQVGPFYSLSFFPPSPSPCLMKDALSSHQVCTHVCRCYRVSAQFEACREAIQEIPDIVKDVCRVLYYKVRQSWDQNP